MLWIATQRCYKVIESLEFQVTGSLLAITGFFLSYTRGQSEDSVTVSCASTCTF